MTTYSASPCSQKDAAQFRRKHTTRSSCMLINSFTDNEHFIFSCCTYFISETHLNSFGEELKHTCDNLLRFFKKRCDLWSDLKNKLAPKNILKSDLIADVMSDSSVLNSERGYCWLYRGCERVSGQESGAWLQMPKKKDCKWSRQWKKIIKNFIYQWQYNTANYYLFFYM